MLILIGITSSMHACVWGRRDLYSMAITTAVAYHRWWLDQIVANAVIRGQPGTRAPNDPTCSPAKSTMAAAFLPLSSLP